MDNSTKMCCFGKILKLIEKLQQSSNCIDDIDNTCTRPFLGVLPNVECYNTRPVTFYGCNNNLIELDYTTTINGTVETGTTSVFRVEKVNDCCVVVSLLIENPDTTATNRPYITTNNTAIINLDCVCAIKCLNDTTVDL